MEVLRLSPFDPYAELKDFLARQRGAGAIASLIGLCRGESGRVEALVLEHFPGFTETEIARLMAQTRDRFALEDLCVIHRAGRIIPGEPIVLVAASAAHRRPAFDAVDFLMDYLKTEAPFWKKEVGPEGSRWVEPRSQDLEHKARWTADRED